MSAAKERRIAELTKQLYELGPAIDAARRETLAAQDECTKASRRVINDATAAQLAHAQQQQVEANAAYSALQKRMIPIRDEIYTLGGVVEVVL